MASTSSPMRRKTSASVRTVVVLPVPPLRDSTAIVSAMARAGYRPADRSVRSGHRRGGRRGRDRRGVEEPQGVAADRDAVAVGQRAPLDTAPVDVDAVEG